MRETKAYSTSDGQLFEDMNLAKRHELAIAIFSSLDQNAVYGKPFNNYVIDWLCDNKQIIIEYLELCD